MRFLEIKSQIDFIINRKNIVDLDVSIPKFITVTFKRRAVYASSLSVKVSYGKYEDNNIYKLFFYEMYKMANSSNGDIMSKYKNILAIGLIVSHFNEFFKNADFHVKALVDGFYRDLTSVAYLGQGFLEYIIDRLADAYYTAYGIDDNYAFVVSNLKQVVDFVYHTYIDFDISNREYISFNLAIDGSSLYETQRFFSSYVNSFDEISFLEFDWQDMSSGEKARLAFLSRLQALKSNIVLKDTGRWENILLIIDEGEQYFHPQWQKEYINFLVANVPVIMSGSKVQIVLTSHSPFVLSDLMKENVVYLAKNRLKNCVEVFDSEDKQNTLAANIHTLFTDAYFMKEGLVGRYVQLKMDEILSPLVHEKLNSNNSEKIMCFIKNIGEPVLRNRLQRMFDEQSVRSDD